MFLRNDGKSSIEKEKSLYTEYNRIKNIINRQVESVRLINKAIIEAVDAHKKNSLIKIIDDDKCYEVDNAKIELISRDSNFINSLIKNSDKVRLFNKDKFYLIEGEKNPDTLYESSIMFASLNSEGKERYNIDEDSIEIDKEKVRIVQFKGKKVFKSLQNIKYDSIFTYRVVNFDSNTGEINIYDTNNKYNPIISGPYRLDYLKEKGQITKKMTIQAFERINYVFKNYEPDFCGKMIQRIMNEYVNKPVVKEL